MKKKNVMGENMEAGTNAESDEKAGTNAESDEKAGTKINKESDAKKNKKFRKEFLSQKQKDTTFLIIKIILVCMFAGAYSMLYIWDLYTFKGKVYPMRIVVPTLLFVSSSALMFVKIKVNRWVNFVISILVSLILIYGNFVMLQKSQGYEYKLEGDYVKYNIMVLFMIFMVIFAVTNSFKVAIITMNIVNIVMGLANFYLVQFRNSGFLAADIVNIKTAANVAGGYSYRMNYRVYLFLISSIAICFFATKLGKNVVIKKFWRLIPMALALLMVINVNDLVQSKEYVKILKVKYFKPQETFNTNGFYITFARSINDLQVKKPKEYSVQKVENLAEQFKGTKTTVSNDKKPNIIMIMSEAYTDFMSFADVPLSEDNMPFFHSLKKNTLSGQMFVSVFAGGTASTEFEALTSNSMAYIPNGITAYTTYINSPMTSLASTLKAQGYGGIIAMHPYKGTGYKRNKVYPLLGFNKFLTMDDFAEDTETYGLHISDKADMERIISEYENYKKNNDKPFFMFNVTMQNHSPFDAAGVSKDIKLGYNINAPQAVQYLNMLRKSDDALKELVTYFKNVKEPTLIIFFGDHEPKIEESFYEEIEKDYKLDEIYENLMKRNTQFVIWANYDMKSDNNMYISANRMSSLVLETAGLAQNGYQQFVSEFSKKVPIITKKGYIGEDGNFYKTGDKTSPYYEWIHNYDIIQYNNIFDTKNRVQDLYKIAQ